MEAEDLYGLNASLVADAMQRTAGASFARQQEIAGLEALSTRPALGPAYTVRVRNATTKTGQERARWFAAIDNAPSGSMFVIQANEDIGAAVFGEMVALRLHALGLSGAVVDGYSRDIQQIRDIDFPYWTRAATARGMIPDDADTESGVILEIGGVQIAPGDLIAADADGVIVCPKAYTAEVLMVSRTFRNSESITQEKLRAGQRLIDVYPSKTSIDTSSKP
jgi:4-hydroxy-4-methyl-2-oxoglutarate aldolase